MKTFRFRFILYIISIISLFSCGEDRTDEYRALIHDDTWIYETMQTHYLWYDQMPEPKENDFFAEPNDFLKKILFKGDSKSKADVFSYVEMKNTSTDSRSFIKKTSTYGFDFELITDPTQATNHTFARVLFVLPNSPASEAGLERGDWISNIGGKRLTVDNYGYLMEGGKTTFTIQVLSNTDGVLAWNEKKELSLSESRYVENDPFYIDSLYIVDDKKIAYLMYNEFSSGPENNASDDEYLTEMKQIFSKFKNENPDAFILDLRYNPGGYLKCAQELASMLAPANAIGKTFLTLKFNDITTPQTISYNFENEFLPYNINLSKIYIITSSFTASASEAIINCLKPYMGEENVITIGETTVGKNVAMESYTENNLDFIIWPVVAYTLNSEGNADYSNGITPTYAISERKYYEPLLPLGNINEYLLKNTISLIATGTLTDKPSTTQSNYKSSSYISSIKHRAPAFLIIK